MIVDRIDLDELIDVAGFFRRFASGWAAEAERYDAGVRLLERASCLREAAIADRYAALVDHVVELLLAKGIDRLHSSLRCDHAIEVDRVDGVG